MNKNIISFVIMLFAAFLFLQGCQDNIILPDTVNHLQAPRLLNPPNDTTDVDIPMTFSWKGGRNINNYTLQVSDDSSFGNLVYSQNVRTTTIRDVTGLNNKTKYYWRVNTINGYGEFRWSTIWNFTTVKFCFGIPIVEYSSKIYHTVQIGSQCWLKENLDVGIMIQGTDTAKYNGIIEKYCYNDSIENCNTYGGLYQWNEAMQYDITPGARGICPPGWHIPTAYEEFGMLRTTVGDDGNALKEIGQGTGDGAGTNTSGFSALLSGFRYGYGTFDYLSKYAHFWSSTEYRTPFTYTGLIVLYNNNSQIFLSFIHTEGYGVSVRCLKD
jgi:uncharacterized protein (TIGR02145 family)